ncbi:MAG: MFS transporter [Terrimicrobiaceae bacterium]|nr:MFS transporter [Terrimicrobiaceae bacterium]
MTKPKLQYTAIFLTVFVDVLGFGIVIPVLPLYAEHFGASPFEIGALVGIFSLMQFFFAPAWGAISDRFGRRPVLLIGLLASATGYLVMAFGASVAALFLGRVVSGVAGATIGAAQAYLADISPPGGRARAMGLIGAAFGLGFVFGPALGGLAGGLLGYAAPMLLAAALCGINALFVLTSLPESLAKAARPRQPEPSSQLLRHVRRGPYLGSLAAYFLSIAAFSMMTTVFALYLKHRFALGIAATGGIFAGLGLLGAAIQGGLIGRLAARFGEPALAMAGAASLAAGLGLMAAAGNLLIMLTGAAAVGVGNSLLMPALSSIASRSAPPEWQGRALGILQSAGSLARFAGPAACGAFLAWEAAGTPYAAFPLAVAFGIGLLACAACALLTRAIGRASLGA